MWPALLREVGLYDGYQQRGTLMTAYAQDQGELEHFVGRLRPKVAAASTI
jgi:glycine oxidase